MEERLQGEVERAAQLLLTARHVVALVGAGLSVESGIPPFRGPGGLWTRFGEPPMDGYQRFLADPAAHWREQLQGPQDEGPGAEMRKAIEGARPNDGHYALAELERVGVLQHIITQNVDGLHVEAGTTRLVEIHGNRHMLRCIECGLRLPRAEFPVETIPPTCPECGGIVKGDGVMFGEPIPGQLLRTCYEQTALCDCMLLVGTSGTVHPAAAFPQMVKQGDGALIEVNPLLTHLTELCDVVLRGSAAQTLPLLVARVRELQGLQQAR